MNVTFERFTEQFIDLSWKWTNDPEIRELIMAPLITKDDQIHWFNSLQDRKDYMIWGVYADSIPVGVVGIKKIDLQLLMGEYFGYIGEKDYWSRGIGSCMMEFIEKKAHEMGLKQLFLQVKNNNSRAIRLYEKKGYIVNKLINSDGINDVPIVVYKKILL